MSPYSPELIDPVKETRIVRLQTCITRKRSMKRINLWLLIMCILSGISGITYLVFDPVVRSIVLKKLSLSRESETFSIWEDPKISPHFKVYFWNFTNPEDFFAGKAKPILQEVGPYTYRQKWLKQNITWHDNGTISYRTRKIFTFTASESCEGCIDTENNMTTLNVPAISAYHQMAHGFLSSMGTEGVVQSMGYQPWTSRNVHELLWGHDERLFDLAQHASFFSGNAPPFKKFGFFLKKNTSKEEELGIYTMYTGQGDPYKLATIAKFNGKKHLDRWNGTECDRVHGSDGASFNPYIQQQDTLWFFNDQLCRAMPLIFDSEQSSQQVPCYRFKPREDVFMPKTYPEENACFKLEGHVIGDGLYDVTNCQFDAPIVLSWPHFLHAEDKYRTAIEGLRPQEEKHGFWFDIQPVTGTTLSAKARIQINMLVKKKSYTQLSSMENDTVIPLLWFEEGIDELGDDIIKVLKRAAVDPITYRQYILYLFTVFIAVELLLGLICLIKLCQSFNVDKMNEVIEQMPGGGRLGGGVSGLPNDLEQAAQPMLGTDSTDTSRVTTATHSRNCSEGIKPAYIQGSSQATRDNIMEDLSARLTQKLAFQFQYNNIKEGGDLEPKQEMCTAAQDNLAAMLPTHTQDTTAKKQSQLPNQFAQDQDRRRRTGSHVLATSFEEGCLEDYCEADIEEGECSEDEESVDEEFAGPNVALVNYKPRLTSVSSSVTS